MNEVTTEADIKPYARRNGWAAAMYQYYYGPGARKNHEPAPVRGTPRRFDPKNPVFLSLDEIAADAFAYGIGTGKRSWAKSIVQTGRLACQVVGRKRLVRSDVWAAWVKDHLDAARPR